VECWRQSWRAKRVSNSGDLVRRLILAHTKDDEIAFLDAARVIVSEERKKQHHVLADDLERVLSASEIKVMASPTTQTKSLSLLGARFGDLPKDHERGAALVAIIEPHRSIDDLVLAPGTRQSLDRILIENRQSDLLYSHGLRPANKIIFCGPPGCGKTVAAEAIAQGLYLPLVLVRFDAVVSSYLGETAANLRKVFDFATTRPMVMLFDEFDAIGKSRTAEEEHGELKRVVNSFLQMLDSFKGEAVMIAATNHQGLLDVALWRRFDEAVYFNKPDSSAIRELLIRNLRQTGVSTAIRIESKAKALVGMAHADIERIAKDAIKQTIIEGRIEVQPDILEQAISRQRERMNLTQQRDGVVRPQRKKTARKKT
jgi:SpoVK/Ycf46/Vps4 family AAA+-type ATPase